MGALETSSIGQRRMKTKFAMARRYLGGDRPGREIVSAVGICPYAVTVFLAALISSLDEGCVDNYGLMASVPRSLRHLP